ncbi:hypothetical protein Dimus_004720 [Dionaea muscipula]
MEQSVWTRMRELRLGGEREIAMQKQKADSVFGSFRQTLQLIKTTSKQAADEQEKLGKLKTQLREAEDELVNAIAGLTQILGCCCFLVAKLSEFPVSKEFVI